MNTKKLVLFALLDGIMLINVCTYDVVFSSSDTESADLYNWRKFLKKNKGIKYSVQKEKTFVSEKEIELAKLCYEI